MALLRLICQRFKNITKSDSNFATTFVDHHVSPDINFNENCLMNNISLAKKVINLYISYTLSSWLRKLNTEFTLHKCLFRSVRLTKFNLTTDPYK